MLKQINCSSKSFEVFAHVQKLNLESEVGPKLPMNMCVQPVVHMQSNTMSQMYIRRLPLVMSLFGSEA